MGAGVGCCRSETTYSRGFVLGRETQQSGSAQSASTLTARNRGVDRYWNIPQHIAIIHRALWLDADKRAEMWRELNPGFIVQVMPVVGSERELCTLWANALLAGGWIVSSGLVPLRPLVDLCDEQSIEFGAVAGDHPQHEYPTGFFVGSEPGSMFSQVCWWEEKNYHHLESALTIESLCRNAAQMAPQHITRLAAGWVAPADPAQATVVQAMSQRSLAKEYPQAYCVHTWGGW